MSEFTSQRDYLADYLRRTWEPTIGQLISDQWTLVEPDVDEDIQYVYRDARQHVWRVSVAWRASFMTYRILRDGGEVLSDGYSEDSDGKDVASPNVHEQNVYAADGSVLHYGEVIRAHHLPAWDAVYRYAQRVALQALRSELQNWKS
jgi:hypothetical protein